MKKILIKILVILASIIVIITSFLYLVNGKSIPGLSPLSLAIVMFSLPYSSYVNYINGKISKLTWRIIFGCGITAGVLNVFAGVMQIFNAYRKYKIQ